MTQPLDQPAAQWVSPFSFSFPPLSQPQQTSSTIQKPPFRPGSFYSSPSSYAQKQTKQFQWHETKQHIEEEEVLYYPSFHNVPPTSLNSASTSSNSLLFSPPPELASPSSPPSTKHFPMLTLEEVLDEFLTRFSPAEFTLEKFLHFTNSQHDFDSEKIARLLESNIEDCQKKIQQLQSRVDLCKRFLSSLLPTPPLTQIPDAEDDEIEEHDDDYNHEVHSVNPDLICRKWNRGECVKGGNCTYHHLCLNCHQPHPKMKCKQKNEPCFKWNQGECVWGEKCHRLHCCLKCQGQHLVLECPQFQDQVPDSHGLKSKICLNWNEGKCQQEDDCKRLHQCLRCFGKHPFQQCPSEEICLNYNECKCKMEKCKRRHVCCHCLQPHPLLTCPNAEVCLNWNQGKCRLGKRCKRQHLCLNCSSKEHGQFQCLSHSSSSVQVAN